VTDPREGDAEEPEDESVRALVRRALSPDSRTRSIDLLPGIQRRLRKRSRGKFFGDGWSTGQTRATYLLVGLMTLLVAMAAYFALGPMDLR
jgi:hypothetical protein